MTKMVLSMLVAIGVSAAFAQGAPAAGPAGYLEQVQSLRMECNDKASMWHAQERLAQMSSDIAYRMRGEVKPVDTAKGEQAIAELRACISAAKEKVAEQYRSLAAATKSPEIKESGKALFVAFASYLDALARTDSLDEAVNGREGSEYTHAINAMQAEITLMH